MNNFSITNRLRRVFNITENSLNDRKVIFPIDIIFVLDNLGLLSSPIKFIKFFTVDELANVI